MKGSVSGLLMLCGALAVGTVDAQPQDPQMPVKTAVPAAQAEAQLASACMQSYQRGLSIVEQLARRLEAARPINGAADMRTAVDDLQSALNQLGATLGSCNPSEGSGRVADPHAGHDMGAVPRTPVPPSTPVTPPRGATAPPTAATAVDHAAMGHGAPPAKPAPLDAQLVNACVQGQQEGAVRVDRLNRGLELARQTNGLVEMRGQLDVLQTALGDLRAALQKCQPLRAAVTAAEAAAVAAGRTMDHTAMAMGAAPGAPAGARAGAMDHSKMAMGGAATQKPGAKPGTSAPMDHSKMPMGGGAGTRKPATPAGAKPSAPVDHSKMPMPGSASTTGDHAPMKMDVPKLPVVAAERIADPACPGNVGQAKAPKAIYLRKVYYFCSTADRDQFLKDPAAYLKKRPR